MIDDYILFKNLPTLDLHGEDIDNLITTEYEDKFSDKGMPIYAVVVDKKDV